MPEQADRDPLNGDQTPKSTVFEKAVNLLLNHGAILATLTIVLGIGSGIAAVILIPKIQQAREQEQRELAKQNLKALGEALRRHQEEQTSSTQPPEGPPAP